MRNLFAMYLIFCKFERIEKGPTMCQMNKAVVCCTNVSVWSSGSNGRVPLSKFLFLHLIVFVKFQDTTKTKDGWFKRNRGSRNATSRGRVFLYYVVIHVPVYLNITKPYA